VILLFAGSGQPTGQDNAPTSIPALLDHYQKGDFGTAAQLAAATGSTQIRSLFIPAADAWIARDSSDIINRRLVATAFAIDLAQRRLAYDGPTLFVLLDWARKEWRNGPPSAAERVWTRAAVALVGRSGGSILIAAGGAEALQRAGTFLEGAVERFPDDAALRLALLAWPDGLPRELELHPLKASALEALTKDPDRGPDALIELAYVRFWEKKPEAARQLAQEAVGRSTEPWIHYLAHFIAAISHESQGHYQDAVTEYAAALKAVPYAQSASIAVAQLLLRDDQANAAFDVITRSLNERPDGNDPWRLFAYGGYVRWPALIADVQRAIH
jgi:tetratricopeptide (TPR) repeat protein